MGNGDGRVVMVPRAPIAAILEREIAARGSRKQLAVELSATSYFSEDGAARRIYSILGSEDGTTPPEQEQLYFSTADKLLAALDLSNLWLSELSYLLPKLKRGTPMDAWCRSCEEWTLGMICGWCGLPTVTAEKMLERKRAGRCQLCRRHVRGTTNGHRLCELHRPEGRKLGRPLEVRLGLEQPKPTKPPQRRAGTLYARISDAQLAVLYRIYREERLGVPAIASLVWEKLGFPSANSCANVIIRRFHEAGFAIRKTDGDHVRRNNRGRRRVGFGQRNGRTIPAAEVDRLHELYLQGQSVPAISREHYARLGYRDSEQFRAALEYAWRVLGYKLRTASEARKLAEADLPKCKATVRKKGQRPYPCPHLPLKGKDVCAQHDPAREKERRAHLLRLRAKRDRPTVAWVELEPHLRPLMVPEHAQHPGSGRGTRSPAGALAKATGIDPSIASRYVLGRQERILVKQANRLLAPLGHTVESLGLPTEEADPEVAALKGAG